MVQEFAGRLARGMDVIVGGVNRVVSTLSGRPVEGEALRNVVVSLLVVLALLVARRVLLTVVERRVEDARARYRWSKSSAYAAFLLGGVVVLQVWVEALRSLGTFLGLLSAGLAIALKDPVANLGGWAYVLWRRPFDVGDRVQVGPHSGDVVDIGIFQFTMLEVGNWVDADQSTGRLIHVPNQKVFTEPLANYTAQFEFVWHEVPILVTFDSDWRKAKALIAEVAEREVGSWTEEAERSMREASRKFLLHYRRVTPIVYTSVKDHGVLLTLRYLCKARHRRGTAQGIWESVLDEFARHDDIDFAYPTRRVYQIRADELPEPRVPPARAPAPLDGDGLHLDTPRAPS